MSPNPIRHAAAVLLLVASVAGGAEAQLRGLGSGGGIGGTGAGISGGSGLPNPGGLSGAPDVLAPGGSVLDRGLPAPNTDTPFDPLYGQTRSSIDRSPVGSVERSPLGANTDLGRRGAAVAPIGNRARTSRAPPPGERRFISNEVVVALPSNSAAQEVEDVLRRHRLTRLESWDIALTGTTFYRLQITDNRSVSEIIRGLEADGAIRMAQPNYRFTLQQLQPASRRVPDQYYLSKLHVPEAHRLATGAAVPIAIIDNGIDVSHPELAGVIAGRFDAFDRPEPAAHHGTGMAGAIAAHARLTGVAPQARILAVRAFAAAPASQEATTVTILRGIDWAIAHGARVINMSFAGPRDPEVAAALEAAAKRGIVLVAAAGNAGPKSPPLFPAADPNVIAVTATDADDNLFIHSNRGRHIAVAAPGVDILVPAPGGTYQFSTGTSVSSALVSGIAALLLELNPRLSPQALKKVMLSTAKDLGPEGRDNQFGAGLADAYHAAQAVSVSAQRAPATNVSIAR
jgi:subtilisin family serine protease